MNNLELKKMKIIQEFQKVVSMKVIFMIKVKYLRKNQNHLSFIPKNIQSDQNQKDHLQKENLQKIINQKEIKAMKVTKNQKEMNQRMIVDFEAMINLKLKNKLKNCTFKSVI